MTQNLPFCVVPRPLPSHSDAAGGASELRQCPSRRQREAVLTLCRCPAGGSGDAHRAGQGREAGGGRRGLVPASDEVGWDVGRAGTRSPGAGGAGSAARAARCGGSGGWWVQRVSEGLAGER